jgi:proteasome lid subunit RPN8/RPN11
MEGRAILRVPAELGERMESLLRRRYPEAEWMTFFRFGWSVQDNVLFLSVSSLVEPEPGDLDEEVRHVRIKEPYSLRTVLMAEQDKLGVGVIHSHPQGYGTVPSETDDDMDAYYGEYFASFLGDRPYVSLIYSTDNNQSRRYSGRAWLGGRKYTIEKVTLVGNMLQIAEPQALVQVPAKVASRTKRAADSYGETAMRRLWNSKVVLVGVGGTGSAAGHVMARAGVGRVTFIDSDRLDATNIERVHGSYAAHAIGTPLKVSLARRLAKQVCPEMEIVSIVGNCLQPFARRHLLEADLIISCTDTLHSRVGLAELAYRYGVPVIDIAVQLDGKRGVVSSETIQVARYAPGLPCPYCRGLVDTWRLAVELMSDEERERRRAQAAEAVARGEDPDPYWRGDPPQILTVGHLTTAAGAIAASYAIGMLTNTSAMPATFFQIDILKDGFSYAAVNIDPLPGCPCAELQCHADQGAHRAVISAPSHWPSATLLEVDE